MLLSTLMANKRSSQKKPICCGLLKGCILGSSLGPRLALGLGGLVGDGGSGPTSREVWIRIRQQRFRGFQEQEMPVSRRFMDFRRPPSAYVATALGPDSAFRSWNCMKWWKLMEKACNFLNFLEFKLPPSP